MSKTFIINAKIVNEGEVFLGDLVIEDGIISKINKKARFSKYRIYGL